MNLVYNSDCFAVTQVSVPGGVSNEADTPTRPGADAAQDARLMARDGFEIVDKRGRRGYFLDGALAQRFRAGVELLGGERAPTVEEVDDYITGYTGLSPQPLAAH